MKFIKKHPYLFMELCGIGLLFLAFILLIFDVSGTVILVMAICGAVLMTFFPYTLFVYRLALVNMRNKVTEEDKSIQKAYANKLKREENYIEIFKKLVYLISGDEKIVSDFTLCLKDPKAYYNIHKKEYEERFIMEYTDKEEINLLGMVDLLIKNNKVVELDWNCDLDEFIDKVSLIKDISNIDRKLFEDRLEKGVPGWCAIVDNSLNGMERQMACINIESDSYILFISSLQDMSKIRELGDELNLTIDFCINMM